MGERLTAEREAEIRAACDVVSWTVDTLRDRRDLLAEIDALRGDVADLQREHADRDDGDEVADDEIAALRAERDEARGAVSAMLDAANRVMMAHAGEEPWEDLAAATDGPVGLIAARRDSEVAAKTLRSLLPRLREVHDVAAFIAAEVDRIEDAGQPAGAPRDGTTKPRISAGS